MIMALGAVLVVLFSLVLGLLSSSSSRNGDSELSNLRNHILQLEQTVTNIESQTRINKQKDTVILSDVLSKLAKTTGQRTTTQSVFASTSTSRVDNDVSGLKIHIQHLEQTVTDLQTKSQTQDKKYAAILSSVLSKLTNTTDELTSVRSELNAVKDDCRSLQVELATLKVNAEKNENEVIVLSKEVNSTSNDVSKIDTKVTDMRSDLNKSQEQLSSVKSDLHMVVENLTSVTLGSNFEKLNLSFIQDRIENMSSVIDTTKTSLENVSSSVDRISSVQTILTSRLSNTENSVTSLSQKHSLQHVAFQVEQSGRVTIPAGYNMKFNSIKYNLGDQYARDTGTFTAPESGIYLFWVNTVVESTSINVTVSIQVNIAYFRICL